MKRAIVTIAALLLAACATSQADTGTPTPTSPSGWRGDTPAWQACDRMAQYGHDGQPVDGRADAVHDINRSARASTTPLVAEQGAALARAVDVPAEWQLASDVFSKTCLDLGYAEAKGG